MGIQTEYENSYREYLHGKNDSYLGMKNDWVATVNEYKLTCVRCKKSISSFDNYCGNCGEKTIRERICSKCGELKGKNKNYCNKCGTKLTIG